jgi:hypothetical protein
MISVAYRAAQLVNGQCVIADVAIVEALASDIAGGSGVF